MKKKKMVRLAIIVAICGLVFTVSCAKPKVKSTGSELQSVGTVLPEDEGQASASPMMEGMEEDAIMAEEARARDMFQNENIHFDFDKSTLTAKAQELLRLKARWLRNNPDVSVVIEGHCDERGTAEYNLALGDRRAKSAMDFLVDMGVAPSRLSTISYGEEDPLVQGHNEAAWAQNRRAEFTIR